MPWWGCRQKPVLSKGLPSFVRGSGEKFLFRACWGVQPFANAHFLIRQRKPRDLRWTDTLSWGCFPFFVIKCNQEKKENHADQSCFILGKVASIPI